MAAYPVNDTISHNQQQIRTLARAITKMQGSFSLLLLRCNYESLRERMVAQLQEECSLTLHQLKLAPGSQTLYGSIKAELGPNYPSVLMVYGLESVVAIDEVLESANLVREAFRNFPFPLVLWINDKLWKKLNRNAPDFTSWATTYEFLLSSDELIEFLEARVSSVFTTVLNAGSERFLPTASILGSKSGSELQAAYEDLKKRETPIDPVLEAKLKWVYGRYFYTNQQVTLALQQYQQALRFWNQYPATQKPILVKPGIVPITEDCSNLLLWEGLILFHIGLCWCYLAEQHRDSNGEREWRQAKDALYQSIQKFEAAQRQDLVAKFLNKIGEVFIHLKDWKSLEKLALKGRKLHHELGDDFLIPLAQDYGFLANVALQNHDWQNAQELANVALETLVLEAKINPDNPWIDQLKSFFLYILAQTLEKQGLKWVAIEQLEAASATIKKTLLTVNLIWLYLQILQNLNRLYFELGDYQEAFKIKEEYRNQSSAYGYNAFVGAGRLQPRKQVLTSTLNPSEINANFTDEITASGREEAIKHLLQRMASSYHKLTVIYGQSGVGKSSILRAGLVPALQQKIIDARISIPIVIKTYNFLLHELEQKLLNRGLENSAVTIPLTLESDLYGETQEEPENQDPTEILVRVIEQLKNNAKQNLLTVLIFDQFEELFFVESLRLQRLFFEFLQDALNLPFVKIVISLREDYLHYLLEGTRQVDLEAINNDILSKDILFYLGNFSKKEAQNVIKSLTDRAHFYLEDPLIEALVQDLAGEAGEVRPIELQVVGTQLQAENITTLEKYHQQGPKQKLVERFLEEVIQDCGPENEATARVVLYALTDENDTRPLKTRLELAEELKQKLHREQVIGPLDTILYILEKSGLVYRDIGATGEFYQLVHDYLAGFIRRQNRNEQEEVITKLQQEKAQLIQEKEMGQKLSEEQEKRHQAEAKNRRLERYLGLFIGAVVIGVAGMFYVNGQNEVKARIQALSSAKNALLLADQQDQLGILKTTVQIGQNILKTKAPEATKTEIAHGLMQMISGSQEKNRLEGHTAGVLGVSFSPDGQQIATVGNDQKLKIWSIDGKLLTTDTQFPHETRIKAVRYSPDGKIIATATANPANPDQNQVFLWTTTGTRLSHRLMRHRNVINSINFSPDGKKIITSSYDQTIKIWGLDGTLIREFKGHTDFVLDAEFSPNGEIIASCSNDGEIRFWSIDGRLIRTIKAHPQPIFAIDFSPNGKQLVSASGDRTLKLWNTETGKEIKVPVKGHNDNILTVNFSPDGQFLLSGSSDRTAKLWNLNGVLLKTFIGHRDSIWGVEFSPDGQTLVSVSADTTARLWDRSRDPLNTTLQGHTAAVLSVSFSPDGQTLASASADKTVKLWGRKPSLEYSSKPYLSLPHPSLVNWVIFNPNGQEIATASEDKILRLWTKQGQLLQSLSGHTQDIKAVTFSPDGQTLASASADKTVKLWNKQGQLITSLVHQDEVWDVRFSPDGQILATSAHSLKSSIALPHNGTTLWAKQGKQWQPTLELPSESAVGNIAFLGNSSQIAVTEDRNVRLWKIQGKKPRGSCLLGHNAAVQGLSYNPQEQILATVSNDKKVRLWQIQDSLWDESNCDSVQPLIVLQQNDFVNSVSFSPGNASILAIANDNGTVILGSLENLDLNRQMQQTCTWLHNYLTTNPTQLEGHNQDLCDYPR
ncbi:nSTAND1 domain-containing NTPase [Planktothrix paucivesiculata]|uniref:WD-40 repeat protein n=1 Tax=Planktothrix paucivesiculata PCC 9631 TaxID=671071 RepID=A0A7Z9BUU2_9CYAN|nr:AAA family ATPase [Planktothrix paucivesiculata]VXD23175.1 WD-40 repeat protein [Planktothrix paucivesiculata PCC 9631]